MDRRDFLARLAAFGFVTGMASLWNAIRWPEAVDDGWFDDDDLAWGSAMDDWKPSGRPKNATMVIYAANNSGTSGILEVRRLPGETSNGNPLLLLPLGNGGIVRWVAGPGEELVGQLRLVAPVGFGVHVVGTNADGDYVTASNQHPGIWRLSP